MNPNVQLYLQILPLALSAFTLTWIVRQILVDTHGMFAGVFRMLVGLLAFTCAIQAYHQWFESRLYPPIDVFKNYLILGAAIVVIAFHTERFARA